MIDILIVNYNCSSYLRNLLDGLKHPESNSSLRPLRYAVTVVDNHSTDGSVSMVQAQFPEVRVIERAENDGYAAAVNDGIAATQGSEILLLNSDMQVSLQNVSQLFRIWERLDFPGILAPLHLEEDGFPQLTWGSYPTHQAEARRRRFDRALANREPWARQAVLAECCKTRPVDWVSGSGMFFSRSVAMDVGPWDPNFFLFFEDIDWCLRVREKGYAIFHTAETQVIHTHGASMDQDPDSAEIEYRRSQCYFIQKHFGRWNLFKLRCYLTLKQMGRWLVGERSGFARSTSWQIFRDVWRAPGS